MSTALKRSIFNDSPAKHQRKICQEYETALKLMKQGRIVEAEKQIEDYLEYSKTLPHGNDVGTFIEANIALVRLKVMSCELGNVTNRCTDLLSSASRRFGADSLQVSELYYCQAECCRIQALNTQAESYYNKVCVF